jgi:hypothetical protein
VALVACAWSCGDHAEKTQPPRWTVRDSAGVTLVSNHTDGSVRGCITIAPDPEVVIPAGPAGPPLFRVRAGGMLADGRIVILNAGNREILFFERDGRLQRAVGRSGSGPGEFTDPRWLGRGDNDTLYVWDGGLGRLSIFDGAGDLVRLHQVRATDDQGKPVAIGGRFTDGSFLAAPGPLLFFDGTPGTIRLPEPYGRYDMETGAVDPVTEGAGMESVSGGDAIYQLPFGKMDIAEPFGDLLVVGDNGTSVLRYYDLKGRLRRVVDWVSEPVPVSARDRREYVRHFNRIFPRSHRSERDTRFAAERPRFSGMVRDQVGWLWVRRYSASWEASGHWLAFDETGVLRCSVQPPNGKMTPLHIATSYMLGWRRDANDEETVVLHALARDR